MSYTITLTPRILITYELIAMKFIQFIEKIMENIYINFEADP